jgi:transposase
MSEKKQRRRFAPEQKAAIVRRHVVDKVPVSALCEEYGIQPSVFYQWQKQAFDGLDALFASHPERGRKARQAEDNRDRQKIAALEAKLARKDQVIAEISAEYVDLKKSLGET